MPADARLLLRAAVASGSSQTSTSEKGIKDRFASYHPNSRALRCTACDYLIIKHESLWASHAASKSHRSNVARVRKEEEEERERKGEKQSVAQVENNDEDEIGLGTKRKERTEDEELMKNSKKSNSDRQSVQVDEEWERFQREVLDVPSIEEQPSLAKYADATIEVKAELNSIFADNDMNDDDDIDEQPFNKVVETEAERRTRLDREDREEILARLEEEQRVQDEADERVSLLKSRFESLKQARAAKMKR